MYIYIYIELVEKKMIGADVRVGYARIDPTTLPEYKHAKKSGKKAKEKEKERARQARERTHIYTYTHIHMKMTAKKKIKHIYTYIKHTHTRIYIYAYIYIHIPQERLREAFEPGNTSAKTNTYL